MDLTMAFLTKVGVTFFVSPTAPTQRALWWRPGAADGIVETGRVFLAMNRPGLRARPVRRARCGPP